MAASPAERSKKRRDKIRQDGFETVRVILVKNTEARADLKMHVSYLNQKYNIMNIGE